MIVSFLGLILRSGLFNSMIQIYTLIFGFLICSVETSRLGYFAHHQEFKVVLVGRCGTGRDGTGRDGKGA